MFGILSLFVAEAYVCPVTHFKCNNHFCIPSDKVCNFFDDCGDGSDENKCCKWLMFRVSVNYRGADKSLARPGRKQARKHVRDARDFNNIETRAVIKIFPPPRQGAEGNSRHSDRNISLFLS